MLTLIKGGTLYGPEKMGTKDVLIVGRTIAKISDRMDLPDDFNARIISATGKKVTPGLIDLHVHLLGGGGEGGPRTRTPEITLSKITRAGVTTVVGCLGTDDVSRRPETLLAKAMQLDEEGYSNGSLPVFDEKGKMIKLAVGDIQNLYFEWRDLIREGFPLEDILTLVTSNPAKRAGFYQNKGSLEEGKDADLLILNNDLKIETVMAKGKVMIEKGEVVVKGIFEE